MAVTTTTCKTKEYCGCKDNKEYLKEHGLPPEIDIFVHTGDGQVAIGEWLEPGAFRNLLVSCLQYAEYSSAVAIDLVRAFYDDKIQKMYIGQVNARVKTGKQVQSFEDFCKLAIPTKVIERRDEAIKLPREEEKK